MDSKTGLADELMKKAYAAFKIYSQTDKRNKRAAFLREIACHIGYRQNEVLAVAVDECLLPGKRVEYELKQMVNQLKLLARILEEGSWVEASIDTDDRFNEPSFKRDVRSMLQPIGPIVISGSCNIPFSVFSMMANAASALAAGSTVVLHIDKAFVKTSSILFNIVLNEVKASGMPLETIQQIEGPANIAKALVLHPLTTAFFYIGTLEGYRLLGRCAIERVAPIPVFAEMSSINPVVLYPEYLFLYAAETAQKMASWIMLDAGQYYTTPRVILVREGYGLPEFTKALESAVSDSAPQIMYNSSTYETFIKNIRKNYSDKAIKFIAASPENRSGGASPLIIKVTGHSLVHKEILKDKILGPYALLIVCKDNEELKSVLSSFDGQLTTTLMATERDMEQHRDVMVLQQSMAGRIIINDVPMEEKTCFSMVRGGPFPATADPRYSSSGLAAIKRWTAPVCYQNFPQQLLPDELKNDNPLHIARIVNKEWKH